MAESGEEGEEFPGGEVTEVARWSDGGERTLIPGGEVTEVTRLSDGGERTLMLGVSGMAGSSDEEVPGTGAAASREAAEALSMVGCIWKYKMIFTKAP